MFDPIRPFTPSPVFDPARAAIATLPRDAAGIDQALRDAAASERPVLARDIVDGLDADTLATLAGDADGAKTLANLDGILADAPTPLDVFAQRERLGPFLPAADPVPVPGSDGFTQTTAHIGENTVTWTNDSQGRPVHADADLSEVFDNIDRSPAETQAQSESADRGIEGDQGGHLIGHRFVKDQGLKNLFPQNGNFNVSAYKTLENEWADWIDNGKDVHISVDLTPVNQDRPDEVRVSYQVTDPADGRVVYDQRVTFRNEAGQHYQRVPNADMADA
jgi:hypothetical protein